MDISEMFLDILGGLGTNFLIVLLASIVPLFIGILLSIVASSHRIANIICSWLSLPLECICPPLFVMVLFYAPGLLFNAQIFAGSQGRLICAIVALSFCFIGYMPARYATEYSFLKNLLYNGLGLFIALFKWSFISRIVATGELMYTIEMKYLSYGIVMPLIVSFFVVSAIIAVLEICRRLIKGLMK